jgi:hypothetical protein
MTSWKPRLSMLILQFLAGQKANREPGKDRIRAFAYTPPLTLILDTANDIPPGTCFIP